MRLARAALGSHLQQQHREAGRQRAVLSAWAQVALEDSIRRGFSQREPQTHQPAVRPEGVRNPESRRRSPGSAPVPTRRQETRTPAPDTSATDRLWKAIRLGMRSLSSEGKTPVTAVVWTDRATDGSSETYSRRRVELHSEDMVAAAARATAMTQGHRSRISVRAVDVSGEKPSKLREFGVGLEELSRAVRADLRGSSSESSSDSDRSSQSSSSGGIRPRRLMPRSKDLEARQANAWTNSFAPLAGDSVGFSLSHTH